MRIVLIYLLLLLSLISVSAQLDYSSHAYVAGDSLIKQQVVYCDPGSKGRDLNWDFSFLQADEEPYVVAYRTADTKKAEQLCAIEHQTRYYYHQTSDSVWCLGYENPTTCMRYSQPDSLSMIQTYLLESHIAVLFDWNENFVLMQIKENNMECTGWINRRYVCGSPYTTCN